MSTSPLTKTEKTDANDAVLSEILAINSALADLQVRVSRLATQMVTKAVVIPEDSADGILAAVAEAIGDTRETSPINMMDGSADTMEAAPAIMEAPLEPRRPASKVPKSKTFERVLNIYETTYLSAREIASRVRIQPSAVRSYISKARAVKDPRALKGDHRRTVAMTPPQPIVEEALNRSENVSSNDAADPDTGGSDQEEAADIVETVVVVVDEPSEPVSAQDPAPAIDRLPNTGLSDVRVYRPQPYPVEDEEPRRLRLPSVPASAPHSSPAVPEPVEMPRTPVEGFGPDEIIQVDLPGLVITGPFGKLNVSRPFALSAEKMADGGLYDATTLRDAGAWPTVESMRSHFNLMVPKLKAIGIELVPVSKELFKLRRLEA